MENGDSRKATKLTWAAFIAALLSLLLLTIIILIARTVTLENAAVWIEALIDLGYASAAVALLGLGISFNALLKKDRSRKLKASLAVSVLMSAFWVFTLFDQSALLFLIS